METKLDAKTKQSQTAQWLKRAEESLAALLRDDPPHAVSTGVPEHIRLASGKLLNLIIATRLFPMFDPECLTRMTRQTLTFNSGKVSIWLPVFAWVDWYSAQRGGAMNLDLDFRHLDFGERRVFFNPEKISENERAQGGSRNWNRASAQCPKVPLSVAARVDALPHIFSSIHVLYEAEWVPSTAVDPLVIAHVGEHCFLIDRWDLTSLERYVSDEFCVKP